MVFAQRQVGWGRVGRGEFAFYLADVGHAVGIMVRRSHTVLWNLADAA